MRKVVASLVAEIGRGLRRFFYHLLIPAILLVVLAWQVLLPWVVELGARQWMQRVGLTESDLSAVQIGLYGAEVQDLSLGGGALTIDRVTFAYEPNTVRQGSLDGIVVTGLRWRTRLLDGGLDLGPLETLLSGPGGGSLPPVPEIELRDGLVEIALPEGMIEVPFAGLITFSLDGMISGRLRVWPRTPAGSATGDVELDIDAASGAADIYADIVDGWAHTPGLSALGLSGQLAARLSPGEPLEATLYVEATHVNTPIGDLPGSATATFAQDSATLVVDLVSADGALAFHGAAEGTLLPEARLSLNAELSAPSGTALARRSLALLALEGPTPKLSLECELRSNDLAALAAISDPAEALPLLRAKGTLTMALAGLSVPQLFDGFGADGAVAFATEGGGLTVRSDGVTLEAEAIHGNLIGLSTLAPSLGTHLRQGGSLTIAPRAAPLLRVTQRADGGFAARFAGDARLEIADAIEVQAGADAIDVYRESGAPSLTWDRVDGGTLSVGGLPFSAQGMALTAAEATVSGREGRFRGRARIAAAGDLQLESDLVAKGSRIALDADLAFSGDGLVARLRNREIAQIGAIAVSASDLAVSAFAVRAADDQPAALIDVRFLDDGMMAWKSALSLSESTLQVTLGGPGEPVTEIGATLPVLDLSAAGKGGGPAPHTMQASASGGGGFVEARQDGEILEGLPLHGVGDGMTLSAAYRTGEPAHLSLDIESLHQKASRPVLVPVSLSIEATYADDDIAFVARMGDTSGNLVIDIAGNHNPIRGQGFGALTLHPILFVDGGFQPGRLSPHFNSRLGLTTGTVSMAGPLAWPDKGIASEVVMTVESLSTTFDDVAVVGVNAAITFDQLLPPGTPPGQLISLAGIDLGLPLTQGLVSMRLDRNGLPLVENSQWQWAGGKVGASFSRGVGPDDEGEERLVLEIDGVELDNLLELTPQGTNIEASGTLYGRIPVVFRGGEFVIVGGWLESSFEGGYIRYGAGELAPGLMAGGEGVNLLLEALDDFRYSRLRLELNGLDDGETEMSFRIRGANPELYGGAEIELNMSIVGRLEQIMRQSYEAYYEVPEEIADKLARAGARFADE